MRVVASRAALDVLTAMCIWRKIFRFVMTFYTGVENLHPQEIWLSTAVRFMANGTFSLRHRCMADLVTKIAGVTKATLMQDVRSNLHALLRIMASVALTLDEGRVERHKARLGEDQPRGLSL